MAGYYDKNKDYSRELQRSDLTEQERSQLQQERQNKIDALYGGREPNLSGKDYTFTKLERSRLRSPDAGLNPVKPGASTMGSGGSYAGTDYHQEAIDAAREYARRQSSGEQGDWSAVLDALARREEKVKATGQSYGKSSDDILAELYNLYYAPYPGAAPEFGGQGNYDAAQNIVDQLARMSYEDWVQGDQYRALADRYGRMGRMGMEDTLGRISGRTGGLASSYAATAAQQQYNDYMSQLEDAARSMYSGERSDLMDNANLYLTLGNSEWSRYQDQLGQYNSDRNFRYQAGRDQISDRRYADETAYDRQTYQDETDYNRALAKAQTLAASGDFSGYRALGYTEAEIANLRSAWEREQAAARASGRSSSHSSGSSSAGSGGMKLSVAKDYAKQGIFNDDVVAAFQAAGYSEEYLRATYGYEPGSSGGESSGMNSNYFDAAMSSLRAALDQVPAGETDPDSDTMKRTLGGVESMWGKLNEQQRAAVQALRARYGIAYEEG